jgi:hypothetical protein
MTTPFLISLLKIGFLYIIFKFASHFLVSYGKVAGKIEGDMLVTLYT